MSSNIHAQSAQLLNQPPNLRPARPYFFGNLRAADDNRSVTHEQAHDAAQANVRRLVHRGQAASFRGGGDGGNYNQSLVARLVWGRPPRPSKPSEARRRPAVQPNLDSPYWLAKSNPAKMRSSDGIPARERPATNDQRLGSKPA